MKKHFYAGRGDKAVTSLVWIGGGWAERGHAAKVQRLSDRLGLTLLAACCGHAPPQQQQHCSRRPAGLCGLCRCTDGSLHEQKVQREMLHSWCLGGSGLFSAFPPTEREAVPPRRWGGRALLPGVSRSRKRQDVFFFPLSVIAGMRKAGCGSDIQEMRNVCVPPCLVSGQGVQATVRKAGKTGAACNACKPCVGQAWAAAGSWGLTSWMYEKGCSVLLKAACGENCHYVQVLGTYSFEMGSFYKRSFSFPLDI